MAIYAIPETAAVGGLAYLTPGKWYLTERLTDAYFATRDDRGKLLPCKWRGCAFGGNWTRVEVDDEDDSVIVSRPAAPTNGNRYVKEPDAPADDRAAKVRSAATAYAEALDAVGGTTSLDLTGSETLKLVPAGNGGWVVYRVEAPHLHDPMIGAFSSAEEMCAALTEVLA